VLDVGCGTGKSLLPRSIGVFDWITCLDDALNYLLGDDDLASACRRWRASCAQGGC
jgi:hypothetical protein